MYITVFSHLEMYQNGSQVKPHFELSYSTKDEYGLQDLTPQSWADLVERYIWLANIIYYYTKTNNIPPGVGMVTCCNHIIIVLCWFVHIIIIIIIILVIVKLRLARMYCSCTIPSLRVQPDSVGGIIWTLYPGNHSLICLIFWLWLVGDSLPSNILS